MRGDFSVWRHDPHANDLGVLYQQGRVTLDADLTAAELIDLDWQMQAGQDIIGADVAAVPATDSEGFRIESAEVVGTQVHVQVHSGRLWADGILVHLPPNPTNPLTPIDRVATYFPPPLNPAGTDVTGIGDNVRDAVILELAIEERNGFQEPDRLIEAALGGPDTAERIAVCYDFRLRRLGPGEDCTSILSSLVDGPDGKGRLTVSLAPTTVIPGDCPVVEGGGYAGFEHNLYRIEVAAVNAGVPRFKWSQFNGGLAGKGMFEAGPPRRVLITANRAAIVNSGLTDFYLEALVLDTSLGCWRVLYAAPATLNSDQDLELSDPPTFGAFPTGADPIFFRLWNGIADVSAYSNAVTPVELRDGIRLTFDPPAGATYRPGDYWTFSVRAGEITNPQLLITQGPPAGAIYHRVALAEIDWTAARDTRISGLVEDCRRRFRPLTNQTTCCNLLVGDGMRSFGDFNSLEEAALHLPPSGGELCLLPGIHRTNLTLRGRRYIRIHGCSRRTVVLPRQNAADQPMFHFVDCQGIEVSDLDLVSYFGAALSAEGTTSGGMKDLCIHDCRVLARMFAFRIELAEDVDIAHNDIRLLDMDQGQAVIEIRAARARIERNMISIWPVDVRPVIPQPPGDAQPPSVNPADPCSDPKLVYADPRFAVAYAVEIWATILQIPPPQPYRAWGGIHVRGSSEQIRIIDNRIDGGAGHGVTLGGVLPNQPAPATSASDTAPSVKVSVIRPSERLMGYVLDEQRQALNAINMYLSLGGSSVGHAQSDSQGFFQMQAQPGDYDVSVQPGYEIVSVAVVERPDGRLHLLTLRPVQLQVSDDEGFLYGVAIANNEIERMALSGIGFERFAAQRERVPVATLTNVFASSLGLANALLPGDLIGSCNVVRDLLIADNRIHDNLRVVFTDELRRASQLVAQGGISLGIVESAIVEDNQVYANGLSAVEPGCGIFVGYGMDLDIRGNQVTGNTPVSQDYERNRVEGLRGGVFVRFASGFLRAGGRVGLENPAVRLTDNRIDQPAGRAITVFAYGPVACTGNSLNSEHSGRWSSIDLLVGSALIIDLGGLHRQQKYSFAASVATTGALFAETLLPGGELLFNSNQQRLGPQNRSVVGTLLVSLDDVGCDGNQSSSFRPDLLFSNNVCIGFSLRVTGNRFREAAKLCHFSLLSIALGLRSDDRRQTMNTTALNQGDHCIVPITTGATPPLGLPVVNLGNLEVNQAECGRLLQEPQIAFQDLLRMLSISESPGLGFDASAQQASATTASAVAGVGSAYHLLLSREATRLEERFGADHPLVQQAQASLDQGSAALSQLQVQAQLASIQEVIASEGATVVDGRVMDVDQRGFENYIVGFVRPDGSRVGPTATTDAVGYFALQLDHQQVTTLSREKTLFLQASDPSGAVVQRSDSPLVIEPGVPHHTAIVLPVPHVPPEVLVGGTVIFGSGGGTPTRPSRSPQRRPSDRTTDESSGSSSAQS